MQNQYELSLMVMGAYLRGTCPDLWSCFNCKINPQLSKYAIIVSKYAKPLCEGHFCLVIWRLFSIFAAKQRNNITDNNNLKQSDNEKNDAMDDSRHPYLRRKCADIVQPE
jgi:hypothetical protein